MSVSVSFRANNKLKEMKGTHKTSLSTKVSVMLTTPTWVIGTSLSLGYGCQTGRVARRLDRSARRRLRLIK